MVVAQQIMRTSIDKQKLSTTPCKTRTKLHHRNTLHSQKKLWMYVVNAFIISPWICMSLWLFYLMFQSCDIPGTAGLFVNVFLWCNFVLVLCVALLPVQLHVLSHDLLCDHHSFHIQMCVSFTCGDTINISKRSSSWCADQFNFVASKVPKNKHTQEDGAGRLQNIDSRNCGTETYSDSSSASGGGSHQFFFVSLVQSDIWTFRTPDLRCLFQKPWPLEGWVTECVDAPNPESWPCRWWAHGTGGGPTG